MKVFNFCSKYLQKNRIECFSIVLFSFTSWVLALISPFFMGKYIDYLSRGADLISIGKFVMFLFVIWGTQIITSYYNGIILSRLSSLMTYQISDELFDHLKKVNISFFEENDSVYLSKRIISDAGRIVQFILGNCINFIASFLSIVVSTILLLKLDRVICLFTLCFIPIYLLLFRLFKNDLYLQIKECYEKENRFFSEASNQLKSVKTIKINGWYEKLRKIMQLSFDEYITAQVRQNKLRGMINNIERAISYILSVVVFAYSGYLIINHRLTVGTFTIINSYASKILASLSGLTSMKRTYTDTVVAYDQIQQLLDLEEESSEGIILSKINNIELKHLYFSFPGKEVIKDLNYSFCKGFLYTITGNNGVGKSTLLDLLIGLRDNYSGEILLNGIELRLVNKYSLRENNIAFLEQDTSILFSKITEFLEFDEEATRKWINNFGFEEFFEPMNNIASHEIKLNASNLSGGEKQILSIIRAFSKEKDILILDEPDTFIDKKYIELLCRNLKEESKDRIVIVVTHDKRIIDIADYNLEVGK